MGRSIALYGLTTCHGTVFYFDRILRSVLHAPPGQVAPADLVFVSGVELVEFGIFERRGVWRAIDVGTPSAPRATSVAPAAMTLAHGLATFRYPGGFLTATPDGTVLVDVPDASFWESFGLVEAEALADLLFFCCNDWIRVATGLRVARGAIALADARHLRIDGRLTPIAGNFPLSGGRDGQVRNILVRDGWIVDEFKLFRPLVVFVLMGAGSYLDQLALTTASLLEFGRYDRDVLIVTDRAQDLVLGAIPAALRARAVFLAVQSSDKIDAVLARLMLPEHPDAMHYAPVLYSDTDVVFDRELLPFLEVVVQAGRMSLQTEPWNVLPDSSSCGAELFAVDPIPLKHCYGFNAGIWAMPGGPDSVQVVATVRRAVSGYLRIHGRDSLPWLDQAMANYVLRNLDAFDPTLVDGATRLCQSDGEVDASAPLGFVHFWAAGHRADIRAEAMARYIVQLRAADVR